MDNKENKKNKSEFFTNVWSKATDLGKKAADGISKGTKVLAEEAKKSSQERKLKKYNPLFPEQFNDTAYKLPKIINIVSDISRREIEICEGAIGWTDVVNEVEVLYLYDDYAKKCALSFLPFPKSDTVYYADNFEENKFISADSVFERMTNEKLAELENVAHCLGAKSCSIEIVQTAEESTTTAVSGKAGKNNASVSLGFGSGSKNSKGGKNTTYFEGNSEPRRPSLKWFAHDDSINGLIEMRCSEKNSVKSKILELSCSASATMSQKAACAIDKILKISSVSLSLERKSIVEHTSKLIFEVIF